MGEVEKYDAKNMSIEKKCVLLQKFSVEYVRGIRMHSLVLSKVVQTFIGGCSERVQSQCHYHVLITN